MRRINLADAKAHLSQYIDSVERGETIVLCRRNVPVAEIRPLPQRLNEPRPVGIYPGLAIPDSFFEPLPEDLLQAFEGGGDEAATAGSVRPQDAKVYEEMRRQWDTRLKTFFEQKHRQPRRRDVSLNLRAVIPSLQSPHATEREAALKAVEQIPIAAQGRRILR